MSLQNIEDSIREYLRILSSSDRIKLLEYAKSLNATKLKGSTGKDLLEFTSSIDKDDLELIKKAIEEDCEQVNQNEW